MQALSLSGPQELHDLAHLALIQVGFDVHCPSAANLGHCRPLSLQPKDPPVPPPVCLSGPQELHDLAHSALMYFEFLVHCPIAAQ